MKTPNNNTDNTPRVYIASLSDYNAGHLRGEWFAFEDYSGSDELLAAIAAMLLSFDEEFGTADNASVPREEWAAHDSENLPNGLYSEAMDFDEVYSHLEAMSDLSEDEKEAFTEYCENVGEAFGPDQIEAFREAYNGQHDSEESFADQLADDLGYFDALKKIGMSQHYFDTAAFARDLFCGDYWISSTGNVFRNN